jgi:hypothetical protein
MVIVSESGEKMGQIAISELIDDLRAEGKAEGIAQRVESPDPGPRLPSEAETTLTRPLTETPDWLERTVQGEVGEVPARRPRGFDTGRATKGANVKPGTLQDLEKTRYEPTRRPRKSGPTRAEQLEGISPEKASDAARVVFEKLRPDYARRLRIGPFEDIHHAIELQNLDNYPSVFTEAELNAFENIRGIPLEEPFDPDVPKPALNARPKQFHNAAIRDQWDRFYAKLDEEIIARGLTSGSPEYVAFVRQFIAEARTQIDVYFYPFYNKVTQGLIYPAVKRFLSPKP